MLNFFIACIAIVAWPLAIIATLQYFEPIIMTNPTAGPHWPLPDLAGIWLVALGTGKYIKDRS